MIFLCAFFIFFYRVCMRHDAGPGVFILIKCFFMVFFASVYQYININRKTEKKKIDFMLVFFHTLI